MADECVLENTLFDADGYIRHYPTLDTMLEFSREDGGCDVFHKRQEGAPLRQRGDSDIKDIQNWAKAIK